MAGGVLDNDTDIDGDSIFAVLIDKTSFGTLSFFSDGRFEITVLRLTLMVPTHSHTLSLTDI